MATPLPARCKMTIKASMCPIHPAEPGVGRVRGLVRRVRTLAAAAAMAIGLGLGAGEARAQTSPALCPGDIALVGWVDNGSPDAFAFVALRNIPTGTVIYFTDNGWTGSQFRGASAVDGDGNEQLCKWTAANAIAAGTIISTNDTSNPNFTWTFSGAIPGVSSGVFARLDISTSGDQVYAFQAPASNPLFAPAVHLFVLDDTNGFENASSSNTGNVPPGLTTFLYALTFNHGGAGQNFMGFRTTGLAAPLASGNPVQWLTAIAFGGYWNLSSSGTLPSGTITVNSTAPSVTRTDTTYSSVTVDGAISGTEYGSGAYSYTGAGNGFGGTIGAGTLYVDADQTNLYLAIDPGNVVNDVIVVYLDTSGCGAGQGDTSMNDGATLDRYVTSNLASSASDIFSILPDFAITFWPDPGVNADAYVYQLAANGNHTFIGTSTVAPTNAGTADVIRELSVPLASLNLSPGQSIDFFVAYGSTTGFLSNETIPPSPAINSGSNPGSGSTTVFGNFENFARFVLPPPCTPPSITTAPSPATVCAGGSTSFTVATSGSPAPTYQWRRNSTPLSDGGIYSGVNTPTLTITGPDTLDAGSFDCIVTNDCGTAISAAAALTVNPVTSIATNPTGGSVCEGQNFVFTVVPGGTGPFLYEWFRGATSLGNDSPTLTITGATGADAGSYTVQVLGSCGPIVTSTPVSLAVNQPASIATNPAGGSVCEGSPFSFTVVAGGTGPFSYQWFRGVTPVGSNSPTYAIAAATPADAGSYTVQVTGACGSATSSAVGLVVNPTASVVTNPTGGSVCPGSLFTFTVVAGGTGPFTYQWFRGATPVGTNSPTYAVAAATPADAGSYTVQITGTCGSATSSPAVLSVSDTLAPVPDLASLPTLTGECAVTLSGPAPTATDACAGTITGTPSATSFSGQGLHVVTWTYDDGNGNVSTQTQNVVLDDVTDPVLTAGSINACYPSASAAEAAAIAATGASDNCLGVVTFTATTSGLCPATVTVTGDDGNGNTASVQYTTSLDASGPILTCPPSVSVIVPSAPANITLALATASDVCTASPVITNDFNANGPDASGLFPAGVTVVTFTAVDECGNTSTCTTTVTVSTCTPPTTAYVDDDYTGLPSGTIVTWPYTGGTGSYVIGCDAFANIQAGLDAVVASTVYVAAGTYDTDLTISLSGTNLLGAGAGSTVIRGVIGGDSATVRITGSNVTVAGFTITRNGNNPTDWTNPGLNTAGIAIQGLGVTGAIIRDNVITGNRTGIDLNNTGGHTVRNNVIDFNRTGLILRNTTDATTITENAITDNWTVGVLLLDGSGGSNSPPQSFNGTVFNNDISGNWYGQIEDRQAGGSLPAPGTNLKNFGLNWLGTTTPVISPVSGGEPGYASQIPVAFGGSATAPGGQPDVKGAAAANFDITPMLSAGTDTDVSTGFGTFGFQGDRQGLTVTSELAQSGAVTRIQEGHDEVAVGLGQAGVVDVGPGLYSENVIVTRHLEINGAGAGDCDAAADPSSQTVVTAAAAGQPVFTINDIGGADSANPLRLSAMRVTGATGASDSTASGVRVVAATGATREFFRFDGLTVVDNDGPGIVFESTGGTITTAEITGANLCGNFRGVHVADAFAAFSGLDIEASTIKNNDFNGVSVHGNAAGTFTPTDITVSNTYLAANGQSSPAFQGSGDLSFFQFNGDAAITNVTIDTTGRFPVQFRGAGSDVAPGTWLPMGVVSINGLDIDGTADRAALFVHIYADVDDLTLSNVDLSGVTNLNPPFTGFSVGGMVLAHAGAAPLPLNDTVFPCQGTGYVGLGNFFVGGAAADCSTVFTGATTLAQKEACVFDLNDNPSVGDVTFTDAYFIAQPVGGTFCPGSTVVLTSSAAGQGPITFQWLLDGLPIADGGAYSGTATDTLTINPASAAQSGTYVVVATNACGDVSSSVVAVNVGDTSLPTILCGPDQFASAPANCETPVPDFTAGASVGDDCGVVSVTQSPAAGTLVGPGVTIVTVTVTDIGGNTSDCTANFTVTDVTPPVISSCASDQSASAGPGCTALVPDFTGSTAAVDACGSVTVTQSPAAGTPVGPGITVVTITATDGAGLTSTCTANFTVSDTTAPTISVCAGDQTLSAGSGCFVSLPDYTGDVSAADDCTPSGSLVVIQSPAPGTLIGVGVNLVTFTVTDGAGNPATCTANITVTGGGLQAVTYVDDNYVGLPDGTVVTFPYVGGVGSFTIGCEAFATIQGGIDNVAAGGNVNVAQGLYAEDVNIHKPGVSVLGADAELTTIQGVPGGDSATVRLGAPLVTISEFTITRQGNTLAQWNDPTLNTAGVAVLGPSDCTVSCCVITGNRTGVDINNSSGIAITQCVIDFNRTGVLLRNTTDNCSITHNFITNNWTVGVLFLNLDPAPQGAAGTVISENDISGNWYAQIQDRMTTADLKDFSRNAFGTTSITVSPVNTSEPGYAALIPVAYGGTAVPPGGAPTIAGVGAANIDFTPFLALDTDTGGACGFQPDLSALWMSPRLAQTGTTGRVQEAHDAVAGAGTIYAEPGEYADNLIVTKANITFSGPNAGVCTDSAATRDPEAVLVPGAPDPTLDTPLIYVTAEGLTIDGFTLDADNPALVSGQFVGAADSDTDNLVANGSFDDPGTFPFIYVRDITLANNILRAANDVAVNLYNDGANPVSDDNALTCNWIDNVQGENTLSPGGPYNRVAVLLYNDTYAAIDDNEFSDVRIGVQTGNNTRPNPGLPASISGNSLSSELVGIWHNLHYADASGWTIADNTVTDSSVSALDNIGVFISSIYGAVPVTIANNVITSSAVGYLLWNNPTNAPITISAGTVADCDYAVWAYNADPDFGAGGSTHHILSGLTITNPGVLGIYVQDVVPTGTAPVRVDALGVTQTGSPASNGALATGPLAAFVSDAGSSFTGNGTGIAAADGARARIEDTALSGNLSAGISAQTGAVIDAGNCAAADVTGLGASAGNNTLTGYGFDNAAPFAIANTNAAGGPDLYAQNNAFGASSGDNIEDALLDDTNGPSAAVIFAQSGGLLVACPAGISVQCATDLPPAATDPASFSAAGGIVSESSYTVAASDAGTLVNGEGFIIRTYTITGSCGGVVVCSQTITVDDTTLPVINTCAPDQSAPVDAGCTALVPDFTASVSAGDNCGAVNVSQSPVAGTPVALGLHVITLTVDDGRGNSVACTANFTAVDATPPSISVCAASQTLAAGPACTGVVPDFTAGVVASDNCTIASITQSPPAGAVLGLGAHTITLTVTDGAGLTADCATTLTIADQTPPSLVACAADQSASADANCQAPVPDFTALSSFTDNCDGALTVTQVPAAGTLVGLGTSVVTVTATDDAGNPAACSVNFTVTDTTPPTITTCAPPVTGAADAACSALVPDFTASTVAADNCSVASITQSPAAGTPVGLGVTPITITVTDGAGLMATCSTTFTVTDQTPPSISLCAPPLTLVASGTGCTAVLPDLTSLISASDNCDSTLVVTQSPIAGSTLPAGPTTVTFTVSDDAGLTATCTATVTVDLPGVLYVDKDATGGANNGSSWADAFLDLQDALAAMACVGSGEIWVAQGTYTPDRATADRSDTFQLISGVAIYGGFNATESLRSQRDPAANVTILSGDIGAVGVHTDNSFHVVTGSGVDPTAILDGFTVTRGSAGPSGTGAGLLVQKGSPTIVNCLFTLNAAFRGGAVYAEDSAPAFVRCTFLANTATDGGGAIRSVTSAVDVVNGRFLGNTANTGGAVHNTAASDSVFTNCVFSGNTATAIGGAVFNTISSLVTVTNSSFTANHAATTGGVYTTGLATQITLASSILWGNTDGSGATEQAQVRALSSGSIAADYCDIQNLTSALGSGNIALDPLFTDANGADNAAGTLDDDLRPLAASPVIDAGSNPALPADTYDLNNNANTTEQLPLDLDLAPRRVDAPETPDTGLGAAPVVDMGAYEFDCLDVDCNENGVCDSVDITLGSSSDCFDPTAPVNGGGYYVRGNPDGIPDECQCVADWNRDGVVNSTDVSEFVNTYFDDQTNGTVNGDINCNGVSNSTDVSDFINIWFEVQAGLRPFSGCSL
jgi:hypothetical protein